MSTVIAPHPPSPQPASRPAVEPQPTGLPVHVVLTAAPRWDLTDNEPLARLVFRLAAEDPETRACCLLPRRLDWLLGSGLALTARVQGVKDTARHAARRLGIHLRLWRPAFEARVLASEELEDAAREIVRRPVTLGLVTTPEQWPYQMRRF